MTSPNPDEPEVGSFSLWFLRGALAATVLVVAGFAIHAAVGLLDRSPDASSPDLDEVDAFVAEAVTFIEGLRERPFVDAPNLRVVGETEFLEILLDDLDQTFAEDPDLVERIDVLYRALGMIGPEESIEEVYRTFVEAGVLGVYFPDRDQMLVRGDGPLSLLAKATIVHELVHAFDVQHFDLERGDDLDDGTELPWTFAAAVEGDRRM